MTYGRSAKNGLQANCHKTQNILRLGYSIGLHLAIPYVTAESCLMHCYFTRIIFFFLKSLIFILRLLGRYSQSHFFFSLTIHFHVSTNINISMTLNKQMLFCLLGQKSWLWGQGKKGTANSVQTTEADRHCCFIA